MDPRTVAAPLLARPPWQIPRRQLLRLADTEPRRTCPAPPPPPSGAPDATWVAYQAACRAAETHPPRVPAIPVGTWAVDAAGDLWELVARRLDAPDVCYTEGAPWAILAGEQADPRYPKDLALVTRYQGWLAAGHRPPPLLAEELADGRLAVQNGHHRAAALWAAGRRVAALWVWRLDRWDGVCCGLLHWRAVQRALASGCPVSAAVLTDYPDLARRANAERGMRNAQDRVPSPAG